MNQRTRIPRRFRRTMAPGLDQLESRQLLTVQGLVVVPSPIVSGGTLFGAAAIASNDIWAVGGTNFQAGIQSFAEHFNGTSWSVVPTPPLQNGGGFASAAAAASNNVWAVGFRFGSSNPDFGVQLIEHWNGTSWSIVPSPTIEHDSLGGVAVVSSSDVWAVGRASGNALVEHWDGTSWSIVSSSAITSAGALLSVSADASNDVWAVGAAGTGGAPILHFNGTTWSLVAHPVIGTTSVTALSPTNVWVSGTVGFQVGHKTYTKPEIEHWDGTSWSIVSSPNPNPTGNSSLSGIAAISANDIWAVGSAPSGPAKSLTEHWDGTNWSIIASPNPGDTANSLSGLTALSDGTVAAVGHQEGTASDTPLILQNATSTPKSATVTAAPGAASVTPLILQNAASALKTATVTAAPTATTPAPLDVAPVDQFFAAAGEADQPLSFAGHRLRAHQAAVNGDLDVLLRDIWMWDRA